MSRDGFNLYFPGGGEVLKAFAADDINALAARIAAAAGKDAQMEAYTTDRAAASVSVPAHMQAKNGVLTRAASAAGLEVQAK